MDTLILQYHHNNAWDKCQYIWDKPTDSNPFRNCYFNPSFLHPPIYDNRENDSPLSFSLSISNYPHSAKYQFPTGYGMVTSISIPYLVFVYILSCLLFDCCRNLSRNPNFFQKMPKNFVIRDLTFHATWFHNHIQ